ncbi:MAG: VCBS repeat-containing protein [Vicinamibacterales bacterium]
MRFPHWADLNGDERADLVVNPLTTPALIFSSAATLECASEALACASTRIHTPEACYTHISRPGDFNGDGLDDLIVSCLLREPESYTATGPSYIVLGRAQWPKDLRLPADADVTLSTSVRHDDRVHGCLHATSPHDLNGDGLQDVLIGGAEVPFKGRLSAGSLYVFYGRRNWPSALTFSRADVTIGGSRMAEGLGNHCAVGDFDGDRHLDIAVHGGERPLWNMLGGAGRTYLIRGRADWPREIDLAEEPVMRFDGLSSGTSSQSLVLADLDGDGRDELFFSAPVSLRDRNAGSRMAMWRGRAFRPATMPFAQADAIVVGTSATSMFGSSLVPADLDGDGTAELLVDEPRHGTISVVAYRTGRPAVTARIGVSAATPDGATETSAVALGGGTLARVSLESGQWRLALAQAFAPIAIDVRPHTNDDVILRPGVAAVGIPAADSGAEIDPASLRAAGAHPIGYGTDDFNRDGRPDLIGYFRTEEMKLPDDAASLTLVAQRRNGQYVRGQSPIRVVTVSAGRQRP